MKYSSVSNSKDQPIAPYLATAAIAFGIGFFYGSTGGHKEPVLVQDRALSTAEIKAVQEITVERDAKQNAAMNAYLLKFAAEYKAKKAARTSRPATPSEDRFSP